MKTILRRAIALFPLNLKLFDGALNTNTSNTSTLSDEAKTTYDRNLIKNAKPRLVHGQFGQERKIPKHGGKNIEFRRFKKLPKALVPLTAGVTPDGQALTVTASTATVKQYGAYITMSDEISLTAIDNVVVEGTTLIGDQAGETLDTIDREVINSGTNVQYGESAVLARYLVVGGESTGNHYLTVDCISQSVRTLANGKAKKINGYYVGIIHPDSKYDIRKDPNWRNPKEYADPKDLYEGEIGEIEGVRFVETTEAKIFHAEDLVAVGSTNAARTLTVASLDTKTFTIDEALATAEAAALVGRKVIIKGIKYTVASAVAGAAGAATITVTETVAGSPGDGDIVYPGEAGAKGRDVYSTLIIGADAYGTVPLEGAGLEVIVKPLGSAGTGDPLNQRSTVGWKATKTAKILVDEYMVRIETASTSQRGAN